MSRCLISRALIRRFGGRVTTQCQPIDRKWIWWCFCHFFMPPWVLWGWSGVNSNISKLVWVFFWVVPCSTAKSFEPSAVSVKWSRIIQRRESPKTIFCRIQPQTISTILNLSYLYFFLWRGFLCCWNINPFCSASNTTKEHHTHAGTHAHRGLAQTPRSGTNWRVWGYVTVFNIFCFSSKLQGDTGSPQ